MRHADHSAHARVRPGGLPDRNARPLVLALAITLTYLVAEVVGGLLTNSLALLADAGHMAVDAGALALALFAMWIGRRPYTSTWTYGYMRTEVVAALVNGMGLWAIAGYIFWEAAQRFVDVPTVRSGPMLAIGVGGLAANLVAAGLLARASRDNLNLRGAFLHIVGDAVGSVGVIVAGVLMLTLGWYVADPIVSVVIGFIVLTVPFRLVRDAMKVLLETSPSHVDLPTLQQAMESLHPVKAVHDIHIWTITSGYHAMSAHVLLSPDCTQGQSQALLNDLRRLMTQRFGISHVTIQLEGGDADCQEAHTPLASRQGPTIREH